MTSNRGTFDGQKPSGSSIQSSSRRATRWMLSLSAETLARFGTLTTFLIYFAHYGDGPTALALAAYAYTMTAWLFIDLGLGLYGTREVAARPQMADSLQMEVASTRLTLALPIGSLLSFALLGPLKLPIETALAFVGFAVLRSAAVDWRLRGESRFSALVVINSAATILQVATVGIVVASEIPWQVGAGLPFIVWALVISAGTWVVKHPRPCRIAVLSIVMHLRTSIGFALTNGVSTVFGQSPILVLSLVYPPAAYASFALMHRVAISANLLFQALGTAVFPDMVRLTPADDARLRQLQRYVLRVTLATACLLIAALAGVYAIPYVRSVYLSGASLISMAALLVFMFVRSVRENTMRLMLAGGYASRTARVTLQWVSVYLVCLFILYLSGELTISNVAVSFACGEICIFLGLLRSARRRSMSREFS